MKNLKNIIIIFLVLSIWTVLAISGGYFYRDFYGEKPPPRIIHRDPTVSIPIIRKYITMTHKQKDTELFNYDTNPFKLDIQPHDLGDTNFRITGQVYKRKAHRDVKIECGGNSNWKTYVGVGILSAGLIYGGYKLINK